MPAAAAIALSGMHAAQTQLRASAHNIANLGTEGFRRERVLASTVGAGGVETLSEPLAEPGPAMAEDLVGLLQAKNAFLANLAVFRADERMTGTLLDTVG